MIRLLVVDDHPIVIDGIRQVFQETEDILMMGEALSAREALAFLENHPIDVIILDISLPDMNGMKLCKKILSLFPHIHIIGLTTYEETSFISRMIKNGAKGYLFKNSPKEELIQAVRTVAAGASYLTKAVNEKLIAKALNKRELGRFIPKLTRREAEVLELIVEELTTQEIADRLCLSNSTIETHRMHLTAKLGARNTAGLVKNAMMYGLI
ncbi:MAG: response regulator transcription factor [Bacteroidota bacterium]